MAETTLETLLRETNEALEQVSSKLREVDEEVRRTTSPTSARRNALFVDLRVLQTQVGETCAYLQDLEGTFLEEYPELAAAMGVHWTKSPVEGL